MSTWAELGGRGSAPLLTTEGGLYRLALRSQRPEAEEFQAWVEDEVLPTLRRTGGYISDEATREQLETLKLRMSQRLYELEGDVAELSIKNTETGDVRQKQESQLRALQRWVRVTCGRVPTKAELKGYM
jgi:prophage antirepressor-like protein